MVMFIFINKFTAQIFTFHGVNTHTLRI